MPDDRVTEEELAAWSALAPDGATFEVDQYEPWPGEIRSYIKIINATKDDFGEVGLDDAATALNALPRLIAHVRNLSAELDRQRERANNAQTVLDGHMSLCCNLKLAKELVAELGTEDVPAAAAEVRRLKSVEAAVTSVIDGALASILHHCGKTEEQIITGCLYWLLCSRCRPVWDMVCDLREAMEPEKEARHD